MAMGQVDVYAFCSCLRFGHVTLNTTSDSVILPSWRWAKDENNMWHCGKNGHFGAGMMACKIIDDYLLLLPDEADVRRLADLLYCALTGWTDFTISLLWYARPPNTIIQEPSGIGLKAQVPYLTNEKWDLEKWMANNHDIEIAVDPEHAKMIEDDLKRLAATLSVTMGTSMAETTHALERMAWGLNSLSAQAAHLFLDDPTMPKFKGVDITANPLLPKEMEDGPIWSEVGEDVWTSVTEGLEGFGQSGKMTMRQVGQYARSKPKIREDRKTDDERFQLGHTLAEVANRLGLTAEQAVAALQDRRVPDVLSAIDEDSLLQSDPQALETYNMVTGGCMGKDSKIAWTTHTFNPWWGCYKVGTGCANCYAQTMAHRWRFNIWGQYTDRRLMTDSTWTKPFMWHEQAAGSTEKVTVFCGSMCDVFEHHANPDWAATLDAQRKRLWDMMSATTNLTWLVLTKRAANIESMMPAGLGNWKAGDNVWLGGSVSTQEDMAAICPYLEKLREERGIPYFLSVEPLLSKVRLGPYNPNWVIIGGESGHNARPFTADHALDIMHLDCKPRAIPVFMKQLGSHVARSARLKSSLGSDPAEWREDMRVQHFPWQDTDYHWPDRLFVHKTIEAIAEEWDQVEI